VIIHLDKTGQRLACIPAFTCLLLVLLCAGCMGQFQPKPPMPDFASFEEGDIVLTFSGAIEAWGIALCTQDPNRPFDRPYTHAEAVYRDARGRLMLGGVSAGYVRARKLKEALPEFQHIAVYRAQRPVPERMQAARQIEAWIHDPRIRAAAFDYTLQDVPGRRDAFCCVGFLNEAYRTAGLEAPFIPTTWTPNAAGRHLGELLRFEFNTVILVDSIAQHPSYEQVLTWRNEHTDPEQNDLMARMAQQALVWYEQGWRLKTSKQFHLGLALVGLPRHLKETDRTRLQLRLFADDVTQTWKRLKRRGKLKGLDDAAQEEMRQAVFAQYRDRYFYCSDDDHAATGLSHAPPVSSP
jgi:hypothetical protein